MSQIVPYLFEAKEVRVVLDEKGEPWFVAADVCGCLDITTEQVRRLDDDEKGMRSMQTPGGSQQMGVVNEPGLYSLVLGSRKPEAKRFKRWVTHEVIPAIRKMGSYTATGSPLTLPMDYEEALAELLVRVRENKRLTAENAAKEAALVAQAPKVAAHARFMDASGTMSLRDTAKVLGEPEKAFIARLVEDKVLFRLQGSRRLRAYAHLEERGYFRHRAGSSETGKAYAQVRVTPSGLDWLSQRYPPKALVLQGELL